MAPTPGRDNDRGAESLRDLLGLLEATVRARGSERPVGFTALVAAGPNREADGSCASSTQQSLPGRSPRPSHPQRSASTNTRTGNAL